MSAQHRNYSALATSRRHYRADDLLEIVGDQDVGEGAKKGSERAIAAGRLRELASTDFVGPNRDGHGPHGGEIRFAVGRSGSYGVWAVAPA